VAPQGAVAPWVGGRGGDSTGLKQRSLRRGGSNCLLSNRLGVCNASFINSGLEKGTFSCNERN
jgi:hypothetical protein